MPRMSKAWIEETAGPLPCPSEGEIEVLIGKLESLASSGDTRSMGVLGLVLLGAYAGLRPKEARLADIRDLNASDWTLMVMHPKGEGKWSKPRMTRVVRAGRHAIERFLQMRGAALSERGIPDGQGLPLVPCLRADGTASHWSSTYALQVKRKVEMSIGLSFGFQMQRRAFGQNSIDRNARLDSVSVALGHKTTRTTELHYARRKEHQALQDIDYAWSAPRLQSPLIEP